MLKKLYIICVTLSIFVNFIFLICIFYLHSLFSISSAVLTIYMAIYLFIQFLLLLFIIRIIYISKREEIELTAMLAQEKLQHEISSKLEEDKRLFERQRISMLEELSKMKEKHSYSIEATRNLENTITNKRQFVTNTLLQALLSQKYKKAKELGIELKVLGEVHASLSLPNVEMISLCANVLDNAIEATPNQQGKQISIEFKQFKNTFQICCINPLQSSMKVNVKSSSKKGDHGYGMKIIQEIVDQYSGEMKILQTDTTFQLTVLLYLKGDAIC